MALTFPNARTPDSSSTYHARWDYEREYVTRWCSVEFAITETSEGLFETTTTTWCEHGEEPRYTQVARTLDFYANQICSVQATIANSGGESSFEVFSDVTPDLAELVGWVDLGGPYPEVGVEYTEIPAGRWDDADDRDSFADWDSDPDDWHDDPDFVWEVTDSGWEDADG